MFRLITKGRRGSTPDLAPAWAHYATIEAARMGASTLLHVDRVVRVMIVRNQVPTTFVEWVDP